MIHEPDIETISIEGPPLPDFANQTISKLVVVAAAEGEGPTALGIRAMHRPLHRRPVALDHRGQHLPARTTPALSHLHPHRTDLVAATRGPTVGVPHDRIGGEVSGDLPHVPGIARGEIHIEAFAAAL